MKKVTAALAAFILLLSACIIPAAAMTDYSEGSDIVYLIEDYDVNITPPDYWMAFTRDDMNEKNLGVLGTTKEKLSKHFKENDIYFEAAHPEKGDIVLSITENDDSQEINDLANETKSIVKLIATAMVKDENEDRDNGLTYTKYDLYSFDDVQYIVLDYTDSKDGVKYGMVYYTIVGGAEYRFTLTSYKDTVSGELSSTLKHMVEQTNYLYSFSDDDSIYFGDEDAVPDDYNSWENYSNDHPEVYDKTTDTGGGVAVAFVIAIIAGILIFIAGIVVVIVLLVKNNKKRAAMQDYEVRTGPDGRPYYYPKNIGSMPPCGGYQPPAAPPVPPTPRQQGKNNEAQSGQDVPDDSNN